MTPVWLNRTVSGRRAGTAVALAATVCVVAVAGCSGPSDSAASTPPSDRAAPDGATHTGPGTGASDDRAPAGDAANSTDDAVPDRCKDAADLVASATWIVVDGQDSLEIVPTDRLRRCRTAAGADAGWSELLALAPRADGPGMRDQYLCHVRFASGKDVWHIEPWRPVVGDAAMALTACNPGGPDPDLDPLPAGSRVDVW